MSTVERRIGALAYDDEGYDSVAVDFVYDTSDPWAVSLKFPPDGDGPIVWTVARCLLSEGVKQPTGDGDFRVTPVGGRVSIDLSPGDGHLSLTVRLDDLCAFIYAAFRLIPEGSEHRYVNLDRLVEDLLGGVR